MQDSESVASHRFLLVRGSKVILEIAETVVMNVFGEVDGCTKFACVVCRRHLYVSRQHVWKRICASLIGSC